jgi:general secretion pathway protein G
MRWLRHSSSSGFTFLELIIVTAVMMILASAALPMTRVSMKRTREAEYRRTIREVRAALDKFKDMGDRGLIAQTELPFGSENYPTSLDVLVQGVLLANDASGRRYKFLRRIPIDPLTGSSDWGKRSYQDAPDSKMWGGQNVYDIYTKFEGTALDGTKYKDW